MTDLQIMQKVKDTIAATGCVCAEGLVEKYYLSLKSRPFVLLAGRGAADLTRLPVLFARALGATPENGRLMCRQVPPDWMDSSDLFGWLNLEGEFIPGAIIDFLKAAQEDPAHPYFLILDRINLSRAEYYLRDVLHTIESRGEETPLPLVTLAYYGRDAAAAEKYGVIPALDNLYVVGTTNLDEASLPLNQKLLDRVHTMYLEAGDLTGEVSVACESLQVHNAFLQTRYFRLDQCAQHVELLQGYFDLFTQLNRILSEATAYVGFTIRNDAILYLMHNRQSGVLPEEMALDHIIGQKVLTRVQGSKKAIDGVLEKLLAYCTDENGTCRYPGCARKLQKMRQLCREDGFASFWN